jgi:hypothetical protein
LELEFLAHPDPKNLTARGEHSIQVTTWPWQNSRVPPKRPRCMPSNAPNEKSIDDNARKRGEPKPHAEADDEDPATSVEESGGWVESAEVDSAAGEWAPPPDLLVPDLVAQVGKISALRNCEKIAIDGR